MGSPLDRFETIAHLTPSVSGIATLGVRDVSKNSVMVGNPAKSLRKTQV
jgi:hypothetical protein